MTPRDQVTTSDPTYDDWIQVAWTARALGAWETVYRLYVRSWLRYRTTNTGLFDGEGWWEWRRSREGEVNAIKAEMEAEWKSEQQRAAQ